MVDGGGFQAGLGACRIEGSVGWRIVGTGWFWGVGWNSEVVGLAASALSVCRTADVLLPIMSGFCAGNVSVDILAPVDQLRFGLVL
jgi:hypothetical protein